MQFIKLDKGYTAIVDDRDYDRLKKWKWRVHSSGSKMYAYRRFVTPDGKNNRRFLHHEVMNFKPPRGLVIDHADRNPLNCRRTNLRLCTHAQNDVNKPPLQDKKGSKYKGVRYDPNPRGKKHWYAAISYNHKQYFLGGFADEFSAMKIYNVWAFRLYGKFAYLNSWDGPTRPENQKTS
jgi:hypothetical protein